MLTKVKRALLISNVPSFQVRYKVLANEIGVELTTESEWKTAYRVTEDIVILGTEHLDSLNPIYYGNAVIILKENENPFPYIKKGISRFIFNYQNKYELLTAFFKSEEIYIHASSESLKNILKHSNWKSFRFAEYDFKFDQNKYFYNGSQLYLTEAEQRYLAEWLLNGHKDNKKRMILCNLRKKFGKNFLKNVNRLGQYKGETDETDC